MLDVFLRDFIPLPLVELGGEVVAVVVVLGLLYKFMEWRKTAPPSFLKTTRRYFAKHEPIQIFISELGNRVILQRDIIVDSKVRLVAHMCVLWGFVGTAIATTLLWVYGNPHNFLPSRLFGNGGGLLLLIGGTTVLGRLVFVRAFRRGRTIADLAFFLFLYVTTITGFATEIGIFYTTAFIAYVAYAVHLVVVTLLLATAPFTSFFHAILTPSMRYASALQNILSARLSERAGYKINYKQSATAIRLTEIIEESKESGE